jgi:hypothetical protein
VRDTARELADGSILFPSWGKAWRAGACDAPVRQALTRLQVQSVEGHASRVRTYTCSAPGAGFFRIEIRDDSEYVDRAGQTGSYSFDTTTGIITFGSGSLAGQHSKLLKPGKFGLASSPTKQFYTVCNLKR